MDSASIESIIQYLAQVHSRLKHPSGGLLIPVTYEYMGIPDGEPKNSQTG